MTDWIFPSNPNNVFDVKGAFAHNNGFVDWTKGNTKVQKGDTVYLYASSPVKSIIAITVAVKTNLTNEDKLNEDDYWLDDVKKEKSKKSYAIRLKLIQFLSGKEFSYDELQNHGLNSNIQSKIKANKELALYLEDSVSNFKKSFEWIDFHEELSKSFLKYKDNREEFYKLVKDSFEIEGFDNPFDDKL
ncbi:MAG: EVE domain-containing protein, partial [Alkalibacterium sp.]